LKTTYDQIGKGYSGKRKSDPRLAEQIFSHLQGASRILNIGAGTGSYEPQDLDLIALEPSQEMIAQRKSDAHPVQQGYAEELPFEDNGFSHAMTVLSMHHWSNLKKAFAEINRVATDTFVAITWNPACQPFWLTRDYFPEFFAMDQINFPSLDDFESSFDDVHMHPLLIPEDCQDGFLAAYWKRPTAYLDPVVRRSISSFSKIGDPTQVLQNLEVDIQSGAWENRNRSILEATSIDAGYVIVTGKIRKSESSGF